MNVFLRLVAVGGLLVLGGCARYPMGLSKAEWDFLPPERQAELRAEQYRINEERRARREEAARQRAAERAAEERAHQERMAELRKNARYRDIILVTLQGGQIERDGDVYPLEPQAFELLKGEVVDINLRGQRVRGNQIRRFNETWRVRFTEDGHTVILNDTPFEHTIHLVNDGTWETGRPKALIQQGQLYSGRINLSGMAATIRFSDAPGKPERIIIEHR
ncbi:MAG: hypothetical protein JJU29_06830 [Verrucomicrobia bacterium]|nr:hypothetical protein [Verrucomicrobiota bacterium]